jgi:hypothetical protein
LINVAPTKNALGNADDGAESVVVVLNLLHIMRSAGLVASTVSFEEIPKR